MVETTSQPPLFPDDEKNSITGDVHVKSASAVDVAVNLVAGHFDDEEISAEESRRLRIKLDWHLLPLLFLIDTGTCVPSVCGGGTDSTYSAIH